MSDTAARKAWLGLLAKAPEGRVSALLDATGLTPSFDWLRQPEVGSVMVRAVPGARGRPSTWAK